MSRISQEEASSIRHISTLQANKRKISPTLGAQFVSLFITQQLVTVLYIITPNMNAKAPTHAAALNAPSMNTQPCTPSYTYRSISNARPHIHINHSTMRALIYTSIAPKPKQLRLHTQDLITHALNLRIGVLPGTQRRLKPE